MGGKGERVVARLAQLLLTGWLLLGSGGGGGAWGAPSVSQGAGPDASWALSSHFDGVVEALRQSGIAAQVAGTISAIEVKVGDPVKAGQVLIRLDAQAAQQSAAAQAARYRAVSAEQELAARDLQRQRELYAQDYISQAALEKAEASYSSLTAQQGAQGAQSSAAQIQAGYYVLRAPYAGIVTRIPAMPGELAQPGRILMEIYDPAHLRVAVAVPQDALPGRLEPQALRIELPAFAGPSHWLEPVSLKVFPTVDPAAHTRLLWLGLNPEIPELEPGRFVQVWLPAVGAGAAVIHVPLTAVVRRAEMVGLYVLDSHGQPLLRQVRLGRTVGDQVEVISGLGSTERVAPDAQAALSSSH